MNPFKTIYQVEKNGKVFTLHWKNRFGPGMMNAGMIGTGLKMMSDADMLPTEEKAQARQESTREELGEAGEGALGGLLAGIFTGIGGSVVGTGELIGAWLTGAGERQADPLDFTLGAPTALEKKQEELLSLGYDPFPDFSHAGLKGLNSNMAGSLIKRFG
jgi:hypothetical protein